MNEMMPKYYMVKKSIIEMINREEVSVNQIIPSERELMSKFGVSRITAKKAIDDLVNEGYLYRIQGKGTYVKSDEFKHDLFLLTSCTEDIKKMGMVPSKKVIETGIIAPDKVRVRRLQISDDDKVFMVKRIYYANSEPLNYTTAYLPCKLFPEIDRFDFQVESIYNVLEKYYSVKILKAARTLEAVLTDNDVTKHLEMRKGDPVLLFRGVTIGIVNGKEIPIETFKSYYRSDKFKFYINQAR